MTRPGGIQRIGLHSAAVLTCHAKERGLRCDLLALNDPPGQHTLRVGENTFTARGFGESKRRFLTSVLARAPRTGVAYIGHPNAAPLGLSLKLLRPSLRYIVATYGIDVWDPLSLLHRLGLRGAYRVTTLSRDTGERMVKAQGIDPRKVVRVPPMVDPEFFSPVASRLQPQIGKVLLTVGRLSRDRSKGVETVLEALPAIARAVPDVHYVVVGDGNDRSRLEDLAKALHVTDRVTFVGAKTGDELVDCYDTCDVFVMPSKGEGFGVVFLEAMSRGKPAIGGDHGGAPEAIREGVTGFLVECDNPPALADRAIGLLLDPALCQRIGEAGRRDVNEHYTFEQFKRRLSDLLAGGAS